MRDLVAGQVRQRVGVSVQVAHEESHVMQVFELVFTMVEGQVRQLLDVS